MTALTYVEWIYLSSLIGLSVWAALSLWLDSVRGKLHDAEARRLRELREIRQRFLNDISPSK